MNTRLIVFHPANWFVCDNKHYSYIIWIIIFKEKIRILQIRGKIRLNIYVILHNMRDSIYCYSKYLLSYAPKHHLCKTLVLQNSRTEISISSPIFYSIVPLLCYLLVSIIRKLSGYKARFQLSSSYPFPYRRVQKPWSWSELGSHPGKRGRRKKKRVAISQISLGNGALISLRTKIRGIDAKREGGEGDGRWWKGKGRRNKKYILMMEKCIYILNENFVV